jgi:FkbM family methyltransferase
MNIRNIFFHPYRNYVHYRVYSDYDYSLWRGVTNTSLYEEKLVNYLVTELNKQDHSIFLDVGANIGLISLPLLNMVPQLKVYGFEPNPRTYSWLKQTINYNKLSPRFELSQVALGNTNNTKEFCVHSAKYTPGDGFVDTKRSGDTSRITVPTQTLDNWWNKNNLPAVTAVKIDTEGAELMVLNGGINLIKKVKPLLCLEVSPVNLAAYHEKPDDVFEWLKKNDYSYSQLDEENFIAKPK